VRAKYWIFLIVLLVLPLINAAAFSCTIKSGSCNGGETLFIRLNSSEAGAAPNNSHAQMADYSGDPYPYSLCCSTDAFRTMTTACDDGNDILLLENETNSHVGIGTATGLPAGGGYSYAACLNVSQGTIECEFVETCSAGYSGVVSMASSEGNSQTNAHVASYGYYADNICCRIGGQNPPTVDFANVTPNPTATTREDLLCANGTVSDLDGDAVTLHYNW
jgi:hypothetical protein